MTKVKLSKRLLKIASMVDLNTVVADIGCDHALLDIYLVQNKIIKKSIASDVTEGALVQAKKNIKLYEVKNVYPRLGDGLNTILKKDKVDTLVLSGLGNQKIISILKENTNKLIDIDTIIIQSNTGYYDIRKSINDLGYYITDESLIKEKGIIYLIIKFKKGRKKYNKKELYYGPILLKNKDELFKELLENEIIKNKKIIKKLPKNKILKKIKLLIKNNKLKKEIRR